MTIYFRSEISETPILCKLGNILTLGGAKKTSILTGEDMGKLAVIVEYKTQKEAKEVIEKIIKRIENPTKEEQKRGIMCINLA